MTRQANGRARLQIETICLRNPAILLAAIIEGIIAGFLARACMRIAGFSAKKTRGVYAAHAYTPRISQPTLAEPLGHVAENTDELSQTALAVKAGDLDRLASPVTLPNREADPTIRQSLDGVARGVGGARREIAVRGDILFEELNKIRSLANREELGGRTLPLVRAKPNHLTGRPIIEHLERPFAASAIDVGAERILAIRIGNRDVVTLPIGDGEVGETALGNRLVSGHFVFPWEPRSRFACPATITTLRLAVKWF